VAPRTDLDDKDRALLEAPNFAHVSTLRADGSILTVPVWVDVEGNEIILNSEDKRAWPRNLRERKAVTLSVADQQNPYSYVSITGHLASETTDGAFEHADRMAKKYMGVDKYPLNQEGDVRVMFRIAPDRINRNG
jgi:PPOX class probable F420-dependent enzyme